MRYRSSEIPVLFQSLNKTAFTPFFPPELFFNIFAYLSPRDLLKIHLLSHGFNYLASNYWQIKFKRHFNHHLDKVGEDTEIDWQEQFKKYYQKDYKNFTNEQRTLFSCIKSDDLFTLTQTEFIYDDLKLIDKSGTRLIKWVDDCASQPLLDYLYSFAKFYNEDLKNNRTKAELLHDAFKFKQSITTISELVNLVIKEKYNTIQIKNGKFYSLLHIAAYYGRLDIVTLLIEEYDIEADLQTSANEVTPLCFAIQSGDISVIAYLLDKGADYLKIINYRKKNLPVALLTAYFGHADILMLLLNKGLNLKKIVNNARDGRPVDIATKLFTIAYDAKQANFIKFLLEKPFINIKKIANIYETKNDKPLYLLQFAIKTRSIALVSYLAKTFPEWLEIKDNLGLSPLVYAAEVKFFPAIKCLIMHGADTTVYEDWYERPVSHLAAESGSLDLLRYLIEKNKGSLDDKCKYVGEGLAHVAARKGHLGLLKDLVDTKPEMLATQNIYSETPFLLVVEKDHINCVEFLLEQMTNNPDCPDFIGDLNAENQLALEVAFELDYFLVLNMILSHSSKEQLRLQFDHVLRNDNQELIQYIKKYKPGLIQNESELPTEKSAKKSISFFSQSKQQVPVTDSGNSYTSDNV